MIYFFPPGPFSGAVYLSIRSVIIYYPTFHIVYWIPCGLATTAALCHCTLLLNPNRSQFYFFRCWLWKTFLKNNFLCKHEQWAFSIHVKVNAAVAVLSIDVAVDISTGDNTNYISHVGKAMMQSRVMSFHRRSSDTDCIGSICSSAWIKFLNLIRCRHSHFPLIRFECPMPDTCGVAFIKRNLHANIRQTQWDGVMFELCNSWLESGWRRGDVSDKDTKNVYLCVVNGCPVCLSPFADFLWLTDACCVRGKKKRFDFAHILRPHRLQQNIDIRFSQSPALSFFFFLLSCNEILVSLTKTGTQQTHHSFMMMMADTIWP